MRQLGTHGSQNIYPIDIVTDVFDIVAVDLDKRLVAFKHVYHLGTPVSQEDASEAGGDPPSLKVCAYPGLGDKATSGLTYGIYDLRADKLKYAYTLYESTYGTCTDPKTSAITQDKYEATMRGLGLDPGGHVETIALPSPQAGAQTFTLTSKKKRVNFVALSVRGSDREPLKECQGHGLSTTGVTMGKVEREGKTVWRRCQQDIVRSTSGGSFIYPQAIVVGKKLVLVEAFRFFTHESGGRDREIWSFSKVLSLN